MSLDYIHDSKACYRHHLPALLTHHLCLSTPLVHLPSLASFDILRRSALDILCDHLTTAPEKATTDGRKGEENAALVQSNIADSAQEKLTKAQC